MFKDIPYKPLGAVNIEFPDDIEEMFKKYLDHQTEETLCEFVPMQVAHTIDVIFKSAEYDYENFYCKLTEEWQKAACCFETPYEKFNINKVFFGKDVRWRYPFTVDNHNHSSDFRYHNYFYHKGYERLDERGLLSNFYQDIDIMSNPENWKFDLFKALYRVVFGAFSAWKTWHITHPKKGKKF